MLIPLMSMVFHVYTAMCPCPGGGKNAAVWQFFGELNHPVNRKSTSSKPSNSTNKLPPKSKAKQTIKFVQPSFTFSPNKTSKGMYCHTLYNLCLEIAKAAPESHENEDSWRIALCNVKGNSDNTERHIKTSHHNHPLSTLFFKEMEEKRKEDASFALSINAVTTPLVDCFHKSWSELFLEKMVKWLDSFPSSCRWLVCLIQTPKQLLITHSMMAWSWRRCSTQ